MVSDFLLNQVIDSEAQPSDIFKTAMGAANVADTYFSTKKKMKAADRSERLEQFFDSPVPDAVSNRIFPGMAAKLSFRDLAALGQGGVAPLLKDPNTDAKTVALLASAGDPDKYGEIMKIFASDPNASQGLRLTPGAIAAARLFKPEKVKAISSVPQLRALQENLNAQLKGDITEANRQALSQNLAQVNNRLAELSGLKFTPPKAAPKVSPAPAGLSESEKAAIKALNDALTK